MMTASEIKRRYPNCISAGSSQAIEWRPARLDYCVGGAFLRAFKGEENAKGFPTATYLAKELVAANPRLEPLDAYELALRITGFNDTEEFDKAWAALDEALSV